MVDKPTTKEQDINLMKDIYEDWYANRTPGNLASYIAAKKWFEGKHHCSWICTEVSR